LPNYTRRWEDPIFKGLTCLFASVVLALTVFIAFSLVLYSLPSIYKFGWSFFTGTDWDPVLNQFGALPFLYGTVVTSAIALLIAVPIGLGSSIFLSELAPSWLSQPIAYLVDLLAAIPSVLYGIVGLFVLVPLMQEMIEPALSDTLGFIPFFQGTPYGVGMLTAGMVLSLMILPFIISVSREVMLSVPAIQKEAILSLGATRWEMLSKVVFPFSRSGIIGSVFLALARALGETMAVTMVIGNRPDIRLSLLSPGHTMAAVIANEFSEATSDLYVAVLIEIGLVLFFVLLLVNAIAHLLISSTKTSTKK